MPLDRAHAHARWAGRYDAQGDTQRSAAHFGRAMHYAQMVQAFGAPKRKRTADLENIVVGLWEHEAAAWYTLHDLLYSETRKSSRIQRDPMHRQAAAGPASDVYRVIPGMLDKLYASESSGTRDSVQSDADGNWYIHRDRGTSLVYLVPAPLAGNEQGARDLVSKWGCNLVEPSYTYGLSKGLVIVQDQRRGCVRVKRTGSWGPATELETFAYYDFLLRYPAHFRNYGPHSFSAAGGAELAFTRDDVGIFVSSGGGSGRKMPDQISDWAWRATFDVNPPYEYTRPSGIVDSYPEESGFLYDD